MKSVESQVTKLIDYQQINLTEALFKSGKPVHLNSFCKLGCEVDRSVEFYTVDTQEMTMQSEEEEQEEFGMAMV